jgi:hypothetical protein
VVAQRLQQHAVHIEDQQVHLTSGFGMAPFQLGFHFFQANVLLYQ